MFPFSLMPFSYDRRLVEDPSCAGGSTRCLQERFSWMVVMFVFFDDVPPQPIIFERRMEEGAAKNLVAVMLATGANQMHFQVFGQGLVPVWSMVEALAFVGFQPACQAAFEFWMEQKKSGEWPPRNNYENKGVGSLQ